MLKKYIIILLSFTFFVLPVQALTYHDISDHWAKHDIETLSSVNVIRGYDDSTFRPNNAVKRDEFICMVIRLIKNHVGEEEYKLLIDDDAISSELLPWEKEFDEVYKNLKLSDSYWAKSTVLEAVKLRLLPYQADINPYTNFFALRAEITRGEAAYILTKVAHYFNLHANYMLHDYILKEITDISYSSYPYSSAILDAYSLGIINGYNDNTLKPQKTVPRAEAVAMLIKFHDTSRLTPFTPQGAPFIVLNNIQNYTYPLYYYPPLINGKPLKDAIELVQVVNDSVNKTKGYIQMTYNPRNGTLGVEFYNSEDDYLTLIGAPSRDKYITQLPISLYMTFTISPNNIKSYHPSTRTTSTNSLYNPYLLVSWGNGHEQDIIDNHLEVLEEYFEYLFENDSQIVMEKVLRYLTNGEGGSTTYKQYNERYASWKPLGSGAFVMEIMER